jgi:hypothetical protein
MKKNLKKLSLILLSTFIAGCSNLLVENLASKYSVKDDFTVLDREYAQFSTKALTESYLKRKMQGLLNAVPVKENNVVKEIAYARLKHPDSLKDVMWTNHDLYTAASILQEVIDRRSIDEPFNQYMNLLSGSQNVSLPGGFLAYYPFNNSPDDLSGHGNNGTIMNSVGVVTPTTDRFGNANKAYYFNGGGYISVPDSSGINGTTPDMTLSYWIKPDWTKINNSVLITVSNLSPNGSSGWISLVVAGFIQWQLRPSNFCCYNLNYAITTPEIQADTWYHVISVSDGSTMKQYIKSMTNDNIDFSSFDFPGVNTKSPNGIGIGRDLRIATTNFFVGDIDDIRIYDRALSDSEVSDLHAYEKQQ